MEAYPSWAYWKEGPSLSSAPASPFPELAERFFSGDPEAVFFVSATMTVGEKWDYWMEETGFEPDRFFICDSPFDLAKQMEILVVDTGMDVMNPSYDETLCAVIEKLVEVNGGATLVLLSSRRLLDSILLAARNKEGLPRSGTGGTPEVGTDKAVQGKGRICSSGDGLLQGGRGCAGRGSHPGDN